MVADKTSISSSVRYSLLTKDEMKRRMKLLHGEIVIIKKQRDRLKERLQVKLETDAISLDPMSHGDMRQILQIEGQAFLESETTTTFQRIFWQQQMDAAKQSDARGMRWHPLMIRFCIFLRHQSQSAYETIRQSKCIHLPSQRTLRDYTHHTKANPGFSSEVDSQLCHATGLHESEERDRHVLLIVDEMHIKEDLVFDKHSGSIKYNFFFFVLTLILITGELIGFTNLNDVREQMTLLEKALFHQSYWLTQ